ncbi:SRPBCC domain-containing protein [Mycobacterium sp. AMU20-3851]|uniref:SRPBCC family protein n=1 Tax=Mycobacterium sp. AMU20-3851 TaxID=3122055 RepID=UPI0037553A6B
MPVHEDDEKRWVEMELVVPGTPEQVWQAIATGPGNTAWFTRTTIEENVGGTIEFDFGPNGSSNGEVTQWEPPYRFGYVERDWCDDAPPVATEITVTGRPGGDCVIRMVHSLFTDRDDWDDQIEGFESGWPGHFAVLRNYLAHFAGRPAVTFHIAAAADVPQPEAWKLTMAAFGLDASDVGDLRTLRPAQDDFVGLVARVYQDENQRYLVARLAEPTPGAVMFGSCVRDGQSMTGVNAFFYGEDAQRNAELARPAWEQLLESALR